MCIFANKRSILQALIQALNAVLTVSWRQVQKCLSTNLIDAAQNEVIDVRPSQSWSRNPKH